MKLLLLFSFCIFSICAFAQVPKNNTPRVFQLPDTLKKFKGDNTEGFQKLLHDYIQKKQTQNNLLAGKQGNIVILPQDHMPCVVPDTNGLVKMPNAWSGVSVPYKSPYHPIPNPALPNVQSFRYNALDRGLGIPTK
jgi:hypothetical protein